MRLRGKEQGTPPNDDYEHHDKDTEEVRVIFDEQWNGFNTTHYDRVAAFNMNVMFDEVDRRLIDDPGERITMPSIPEELKKVINSGFPCETKIHEILTFVEEVHEKSRTAIITGDMEHMEACYSFMTALFNRYGMCSEHIAEFEREKGSNFPMMPYHHAGWEGRLTRFQIFE